MVIYHSNDGMYIAFIFQIWLLRISRGGGGGGGGGGGSSQSETGKCCEWTDNEQGTHSGSDDNSHCWASFLK